MRKGGYNVSLKYTPTQNQDENNQQREQRKQKIMWFNPPYSLDVRTNVGKLFLKLLDHHFPRAHKFYKIFNCNTVKISYCYPPTRNKFYNRVTKIMDAITGKKKTVC